MKVIKGLFVLICLAAVLLQSCQEKMICPAYQSTFILDDEARYELFSRFEHDSVPKPYAGVPKSTFGLIKPLTKKKRERQMAIVAMRNILPVKKEDSLTTSATDITPIKREMRE
jgi:hypothetical protein